MNNNTWVYLVTELQILQPLCPVHKHSTVYIRVCFHGNCWRIFPYPDACRLMSGNGPPQGSPPLLTSSAAVGHFESSKHDVIQSSAGCWFVHYTNYRTPLYHLVRRDWQHAVLSTTSSFDIGTKFGYRHNNNKQFNYRIIETNYRIRMRRWWNTRFYFIATFTH